jgi:crotonobetainyl-CoA:carnitine CoA-transferase CaiB-like acyl-CoA transferase
MRLDGVRVLDLTRLLPGPYATQLLADAGADVVKIEDTGAGDYARAMEPTVRGHGAIFDAVNRGKRSVALDLKTDAGREAFLDLAATADAVVESFRPGVVDRLGVGPDAVRERNGAVVYCSLSGYGGTGPRADRVGHDLNYAGLAGFLDMNRESTEAPPTIPGYPIVDMGGGLLAAFAVVSGLLSRELGDGTGEFLDVGMTDAVVSFSQAVAPAAFAGDDPRPGETALSGGAPWYDVYECADGRYVTVAALEPAFWGNLCEALDRPEWRDRHGTDDPAEREALREALAETFADRPRDDWVEAFAGADAPVEGVYTPAEALSHPQIDARGYVERAGDAPPRVGLPIRGDAVDPDPAPDVPDHGEHTEALLREAGYDDADLGRLRATDAVL